MDLENPEDPGSETVTSAVSVESELLFSVLKESQPVVKKTSKVGTTIARSIRFKYTLPVSKRAASILYRKKKPDPELRVGAG